MIIEILLYTILTYKGSQLVNVATGGQDGLTLTEQSYQDCKNKQERCTEKDVYTVAFFPADTVYTTLNGRADLIGASHGEIWGAIGENLPTISNVQPNYGGAKYNQFISKKR